jgi:hypothetical protein
LQAAEFVQPNKSPTQLQSSASESFTVFEFKSSHVKPGNRHEPSSWFAAALKLHAVLFIQPGTISIASPKQVQSTEIESLIV